MKTKKDLIGLGAVVAILLAVGAFADLQISHQLYNMDSAFGKLFEAIGEFPASLTGSFCAMIMAVVLKKRNGNKWNFKSAGSLILSILFAIMAGFLVVGYLNGPKIVAVVLSAAIIVGEYLAAKSISEHHSEEAYKAAVFGLQLFLIVMLLFNLLKLGWGRERYRHMIAAGSFAGFTPWYLPQGLASGNEFMSFPSGHSANASIIMWITLLPTFVPKLKDKEMLLKIVACIWIGMVMLSRVIMGAHFLSDVTAGMGVSLLTFYILYQKKYVKK